MYRPLGTLNYARIWHDNSGKGKFQSWYLNYMVVRDLQKGTKFFFVVNQWFAVEEDDGLVSGAGGGVGIVLKEERGYRTATMFSLAILPQLLQ